jgi:hypothetical protein
MADVFYRSVAFLFRGRGRWVLPPASAKPPALKSTPPTGQTATFHSIVS